MDAADQHAAALAIVHEEAGRTLSKADFDLCMRISKRALARSDAAQAPEAAAYLVTGLNECNEEWASAWIKRGNADAAAARLYRGAVTPLYAAPVAPAAGVPQDLLPNAMWTRHGAGSTEWWSFKGYEARKDSADQWVLRKAGEELYRHTYLQVIMAHAERAILEAAPAPAVAPAAAPSEWQPIETVPKDGTEVALLFAADIEILGEIRPRVRAASWCGDWSIPYSRNNPPTHWAHLPAAPQGAAQ